MARTKKESKKEANFKEFSYDGKEISYTGRIYPDFSNSTSKCDMTPMNITLNGVITIKGCKLMQTDKSTWIDFPSYKDKSGEYQSYFFIDKDFSKEEIDKVAKAAEDAIAE